MSNWLKNSYFWLFLIFLLAAVLRFYRLPEYLQFLGDEGRDVLVVKRMIVDREWTLLGPTASVGGFYIGPIYYYFMLPFLWLFNLDPVGPAVMVVLFGLGVVILTYIVGKRMFDKRVGLLAAFLVAISPRLTYISRFSWNPNPMPFFGLLTALFLYLSAVRRRKVVSLMAGVSVGVMLQLHYIDFVFVPILLLSVVLTAQRREAIWHLLAAIVGVLLGNSLFLIFELRHGFPNLRSVFEFVTRGTTIAPRTINPFSLFDDVVRRLYEAVSGLGGNEVRFFYYTSVGMFFVWVVRALRSEEKRVGAVILLVWFLVGVLGIGLYRGQLLPHYFGFLFPLPYLFLAVASGFLLAKKRLLLLGVVYLVSFTVLSIRNMYFWSPPNNLVEQTKVVDRIVLELTGGRPYNFALITPGNSDHAYRYFLELWGRTPATIENPDVDPKRESVTEQLIVVCEEFDCKPLGHPLWEVAGFGRAEIEERRDGPVGIKVYRLVHYDESQKLKVKI